MAFSSDALTSQLFQFPQFSINNLIKMENVPACFCFPYHCQLMCIKFYDGKLYNVNLLIHFSSTLILPMLLTKTRKAEAKYNSISIKLEPSIPTAMTRFQKRTKQRVPKHQMNSLLMMYVNNSVSIAHRSGFYLISTRLLSELLKIVHLKSDD